MPLRTIFMGTPHFAVPTLEAIHAAGHDLAAVYTQPPRPAGRRGLDLTRSPVHLTAAALGIEIRTPESLKSAEEEGAFRALAADVAVVVAYGLLLPGPFLAGTRFGAYNGHASLLPRWRGAAPINRAIMAGDRATGVMIMKMEAGLDTGPVALAREVAVGEDETAGELHDRLKAVTAELFVQALDVLEAGALQLTRQGDRGQTYARKLAKAETRIDWHRPAAEVKNRINGLSPVPGAWCEAPIGRGGERLRLLRASKASGRGEPGEILDEELAVACGDGAVRLVEVQRAGGRPTGAAEFLRGVALEKGRKLT